MRKSTIDYIDTVTSFMEQAIAGEPMIFFDLETTGLKRSFNRILSCSAVKYRYNAGKFEEIGKLDFFMNPGFHIPDEASEVNGITDFIRQYSPANYDSGVLDELDRLANMGNDGDEDDPDANSTVDEYSSADRDLFSQCVEMAVRDREVSTSLIQRRLKLGYARAGRLVDEMEQRGIISAKDGAKPRRCLISMEQYEAMKASGELK